MPRWARDAAVVIVILVSILGAVVLGAMGWLIATVDEGIPDETTERHPDLGPVDRQLWSSDVPALRFRLAWRGYRMSDVDQAMSRLGEALSRTESELASLRTPRKDDAVDG